MASSDSGSEALPSPCVPSWPWQRATTALVQARPPSHLQPSLVLLPSHPAVPMTLNLILSRAMPLSLDLLVLSELVSSCGLGLALSLLMMWIIAPSSTEAAAAGCTSCTRFCTDGHVATALPRDRFLSLCQAFELSFLLPCPFCFDLPTFSLVQSIFPSSNQLRICCR